MVPILALWLVAVAQVPAKADAVVTGCPPRLMQLKADDAGKVMITVIAGWKTKATGVTGNRDGTGTPIIGIFSVDKTIELGDLKDLTISTAAGVKVMIKDARQKLAGGATVVISGDGKAVSADFLKVFKDDTLVLASPELVDARFGDPLGIIPANSPDRK